jgi:hypothetical protein
MTLNKINGKDITDYHHSNSWEANNENFFYERGPGNNDGSITGSIYKFIGETHCKKIGSIKILPNGKVKRWPGMPKDKIIEQKPMFQII